jgi:hypothetical protein
VVADDLARDIAERPELTWALKQDLARELAIVADGAFLRGAPGDRPAARHQRDGRRRRVHGREQGFEPALPGTALGAKAGSHGDGPAADGAPAAEPSQYAAGGGTRVCVVHERCRSRFPDARKPPIDTRFAQQFDRSSTGI